MADRPTFKPLALSEQEMLTVALPDQAPGRADDAQTAIIKDADLQSTDQWSAMAELLESGGLDEAIAREDGQQRPNRQQEDHQPLYADETGQQAPPQRKHPGIDPDHDDYSGSEPPEIGLFPTLNQNPLFPGQVVQPPVAPQFVPAPASREPEPEPAPVASEDQTMRPPQHRIRGGDDVESLALELRTRAEKSGKTLKLKDAIALAEKTLGVEPEPEKEQSVGIEIPEGYPSNIEDIDAELENIELRRIDCREISDFEGERELVFRERDLKSLRPKLLAVQKEREETYNTAFEQSWGKVRDFWPMAGDNLSEFARDLAALDAALLESGDERYHHPDKPMMLAREVAKRRSILPVLRTVEMEAETVSRVASTAQAAGERKFQAAPPIPASGASRSTSQAPTMVGGISLDHMNEDAYLALKDAF